VHELVYEQRAQCFGIERVAVVDDEDILRVIAIDAIREFGEIFRPSLGRKRAALD